MITYVFCFLVACAVFSFFHVFLKLELLVHEVFLASKKIDRLTEEIKILQDVIRHKIISQNKGGSHENNR